MTSMVKPTRPNLHKKVEEMSFITIIYKDMTDNTHIGFRISRPMRYKKIHRKANSDTRNVPTPTVRIRVPSSIAIIMVIYSPTVCKSMQKMTIEFHNGFQVRVELNSGVLCRQLAIIAREMIY